MMDEKALLQAIQQMFAEERAHTQRLFIEERKYTQQLLAEELAPIRQSIVKLEDLPRQIRLIAEGHMGTVERLDRIESRLDSIENQLENAVIVKAAQ